MKIARIVKNIKCDTVLCGNNADYELILNSFKGSAFLCEKCFKAIQNLFKRISTKDGKEQAK